MADVDDEFLALVGGDDASDDEVESSTHSRPVSESPEADGDHDTTAKARRREHHESDEEEEGEASSVAGSEDSAPMDESDSESDSFPVSHAPNSKMDDDEDIKYPYEGIYASEAEKEEILSMPELEREQLIAKRQEEIDRQRQNTLLRQLLQRNKQDSSLSTRKRKASSVELEDGQRKTSRQRTQIGSSKVGEKSAGLASLRRARAEKSDRQRHREEERAKGKSSTQDGRHDDSDGEDVFAESDRDVSRSPSPERKKISPPADLRDFERVRLSRSRFAEVCFHPGFDEAITGCYCRVAVGPNRETGQPEYKMGVIKGFTPGRPYAMLRSNKTFITDQYVKIAHGKTVAEYPFISCSDSPFTEDDYERYRRLCQEDGVPFPKREQVDAKIDDINALRNRVWTDKEVSDRLARMQSLMKKYDSSERNRLVNKLDEAKERGDDARVAELQEQLDKMEVPKLAFRTSSLLPAKKSAPSTPSQQDRLAQLNAQRRRENAEAVRKAQIAERARIRMIEAKLARGEQVIDDTSRRLPTKPKFLINDQDQKKGDKKGEEDEKEQKDADAKGTAAKETPKLKPITKTPLPPHMEKLHLMAHQADKNGIPHIHRPIRDDEIIAALDLELDVEIE
ncbi:hypothetical protein F5Y17DRAFT_446737 [Xylariaceae sp. FL0594]|nr:hypothetical protein F5Y17DRAFT_446737 [Xylariaceae sp. FL0594]